MLNEIVISKSPSRPVVYKNGSVEGLSVETIAIDGNCQIVLLNF
jgi:hypothetical protein